MIYQLKVYIGLYLNIRKCECNPLFSHNHFFYMKYSENILIEETILSDFNLGPSFHAI